MRCFDKVSKEQREILFAESWKMADFNIQNSYIRGCIHVLEVSKSYGLTTPSSSTRSNTRIRCHQSSDSHSEAEEKRITHKRPTIDCIKRDVCVHCVCRYSLVAVSAETCSVVMLLY